MRACVSLVRVTSPVVPGTVREISMSGDVLIGVGINYWRSLAGSPVEFSDGKITAIWYYEKMPRVGTPLSVPDGRKLDPKKSWADERVTDGGFVFVVVE
ncbi:hypothetical protein HYW55_01120 [Candidatus Gottesmanbacteria bacterium]|nr:hypothetical protein [Candidatus Gottesmanbacteria bacterium]